MPVPMFEWKSYYVPDGTDILIPDLTPWPTPREKADVLLQKAAEVEHALLVQYLYAAYSLNTTDLNSPAFNWQSELTDIATQEMGHLLTVQNMRLALGLSPTFVRDDFPLTTQLYPFPLELEPLTRDSLAKYIVSESPVDAHLSEDICRRAKASAGGVVNHVGTIYGLLAFVFTESTVKRAESPPSTIWDTMLGKIAHAATCQDENPTAWHLPKTAFVENPEATQADMDWKQGGDLIVDTIADRVTAIVAIRQIAEEGEGFHDGERSHFQRFLNLFQSTEAEMPTYPVPTGQRISAINNPQTWHWAQLADLRYAMLLGEIEHYLRTGNKDHRTLLKDWAFADMHGNPQTGADSLGLDTIAAILTQHPQGSGVAGLPFTMPTTNLSLPGTNDADWWNVHRTRIEAAIATINCMQHTGGEDQYSESLAKLLATLEERRKQIPQPPTDAPPPLAGDEPVVGPMTRTSASGGAGSGGWSK